jgi:hypothetical protein
MITSGILKPLSDAPAPAGEVASNSRALPLDPAKNAHPSLNAGSASPFPPACGPAEALSSTWNRLLTATGRRFHTLRDAVAVVLLNCFGPVEFSISVRRGYLYTACPTCSRVKHDEGEMCPRQLSGDCTACGQRVLLDGFGNCPEPRATQRTHVVTNRRPTTMNEWRRPRAIPRKEKSMPGRA